MGASVRLVVAAGALLLGGLVGAPSGNFLRAVAGASRTDLWIGGETFISGPSSNALHFDGGRWNIVRSPLGIIP